MMVQNQYRTWLAVSGGLMGAVAASACCVVPLVLLWLGISGAWIANLTALAAYHEAFIGFSVLLLLAGYSFIYRRRVEPCDEGEACAKPLPDKLVKASFWLAVVTVTIAAVFPYLVTQYYGV
ncbi:MAG: mercuric transporter MerT family protein [Gammaproteobacteria bacterium]|nr:mercuric transporter MerT family protein [Gammaproteobacteria bacterium]